MSPNGPVDGQGWRGGERTTAAMRCGSGLDEGAVAGVGLLTTLWSGLNWMNTLRVGVSAMWKVDANEGGNFVTKKLADLVGLIVLIALFIVAAVVTALGVSSWTSTLMDRLDVGDFGLAWGGISSLQLGLPAVWTGARARGHSLVDVVRWMAEGPARIVGLERKGRLEVGADADLCVFAPDEAFVVDPARLHHRNPVTPYAGRSLDGVVRSTWLRGERIELTTPRGRLLDRGTA